ncbi:MAG: B12-binding domain-containing radical SAM protein [Eggerthellaceae bacterium]|nr:B12-binding domain-containing radical SAM protein [Eggerthellaceae bacterium]
MEIRKVRFIEPGAPPYRRSPLNLFVYDRYIRNPSTGLMTLATIVQRQVPDTLMYSESISKVRWDDCYDADVVFIGAFTFAAPRGYAIADKIRRHSKAIVVIGGLHATACPEEAAKHADYVLLGEGDETILSFLDALRADQVPSFDGIARFDEDGVLHDAGMPKPPHDIDTIPNRHLVWNYHKMAGHNTLWGQVHASRGCPYNCDYCALVRLYGRRVRTRSPQNVVEDIRQCIAFHDEGRHRIATMLWLTDDNFFADKEWALSVLDAIIESDIDYRFTIQARYEVGLDDEMLERLAKAGFVELSLGIEFIEDESFQEFHKRSTTSEIERAIANIHAHGIRARGLFIFGAPGDRPGVGKAVANFAIENGIQGMLLQSMYFIPGTPVYDRFKGDLLHTNWEKCVGNVVHRPRDITPRQLQREMIICSKTYYSWRRLLHSLVHDRGIDRVLFAGEFFWQMSERSRYRRELRNLPDA